MEALLYLDLSTGNLTETLNGSRFNFQPLTFGDTLSIGLRFAKREAGVISEVSRDVQSLHCSIGRIDARPEFGTWGFKIGSDNADVVTGLAHNVKGATIASAINSLTLPSGLGTATVEEKSGSWLIRFADETTDTPVTIVSHGSNTLFPVSHVKHATYQEGGKWVHELRLVQSPVASTSSSSRVLPPAPSVTTLQNGGEDTGSGAVWNEIQDLYISPTFRGLYQIKRGYKRTGLLNIADGAAEIAAALQPLADEGGVFVVTNPESNHAHIEFAGTMAGTNQSPLVVEVYSAPEGDLTFHLDLGRPALAALLRREPEVTLPIEIYASITDENDEETDRKRKLYQGEVTIRRELHWDGLATSQDLDWLRPPLPEQYRGFNYSQINSGVLHYADSYGNNSATVLTVDHNLDAEDVNVIVKDNDTGLLLALGTDYTVDITSSDSLTVTSLVGAPDVDQWRIAVMALGEASSFDPHTHDIDEITGLQTILDAMGADIADLKSRAGLGALPIRSASDTGIAATWQLPEIFEVYPDRYPVAVPTGRLVELDPTPLTRAQGLLAAVHDASTESLPLPIPAPASALVGRVFRNQSGSTVRLPGGKGHSSVDLKANEFAACDGRIWYPVTRYGEHASGTTFTTNYASDANRLNATDNELPDGTLVRVSTTGTLPTGLSANIDYQVINRTDDTIELAAVGSTTPITLTGNGTGTHTVTRITETSYYPRNFERTLFTIHVNDRQLRLRKKFEMRFALEAAVLKANTSAFWTLAIEVGERTEDSTPATTGHNLDAIVWRGTPMLEQKLVITPVSAIHQFGMRVERYSVSGVDTLKATGLAYGDEVGCVAPKSANFALRARLIRFDTEDSVSSPTGFVAIRGLSLQSQGATNHGAAEVS